MKRIPLTVMTAMLSAALCFATSCTSKKETGEQSHLSPGQARQIEALKKNEAEARKVIVAKVNGAPITMSTLLRYMNALAARYAHEGQSPSPQMDEQVKKAALNELIFEELAIQEATRQGITLRPGDIDNELKKVKARFRSDEEYRTYLDTHAATEEDLRKEIERKLLYDAIAAKEIRQKLDVRTDDKTLKAIYEKNKAHFALPERIAATDLYFTSGRDDAPTREKSREILAALKKNGDDMNKLAPDGSFVIRQIVVTEAGLPAIYGAISRMKTGKVSGVIAERDGLHIVRPGAKEAARRMTFVEAKPFISRELVLHAVEQRKEAWDRELRKNAKIETIDIVAGTQKPAG